MLMAQSTLPAVRTAGTSTGPTDLCENLHTDARSGVLHSTITAAARAILERIMRHDRIEFIIGTKVNESHQDPGIPQDLELRRTVVRRIAQTLEQKYRKSVIIQFF